MSNFSSGDHDMSFSKGIIAGIVLLTGCTAVTEDPKSSAPQKVELGLLDVNTEMSAQGTMVAWDNARTEYPLSEQWKFGIEFEFDINVIQDLYAFLDSDQNFDCNFGATLMGPSYYLKLADGSTVAYDYENRGSVKKFPGTGSPDFPGLLQAGSHKLIARWFSNEECRMDVAVAVRDRFAPAANFGPSIQRVDLLGTWQAETVMHKYGMDGTLTVSEEPQPGESVLEIFDFPYHERYTARVKSAAEGSGYKIGDVFYCAYDINSDAAPGTMLLSCNEPGDTSIPDPANGSDLFSK
jgi:hypothetical protein